MFSFDQLEIKMQPGPICIILIHANCLILMLV